MRKLFIYSQDEIEQKVQDRLRQEKGTLLRWELEVSDSEWPRVHIHYYHMDDGQGEHICFFSLQGPEE